MPEIFIRSIGFGHFRRPDLEGPSLPHLTRRLLLEKGPSHRIEQGIVGFEFNPNTLDAGSSRITALIFDPQGLKLHPLIARGSDKVGEHWFLNPGVCVSRIQTIAQYLADFRNIFPQARIIAATNGNNLYSHPMDILIRTENGSRKLLASAEGPDGARTCLVYLSDNTAEIRKLGIRNGELGNDASLFGVVHAIYGQQILNGGQVVDLAASGLYRELLGNCFQMFHLPRFRSPRPGYSFTVERIEKSGSWLGAGQLMVNEELALAALLGRPVTLEIPNFALVRRFSKPGETPSLVTQAEIDEARQNGTAVEGKIEALRLTEDMIKRALFDSGYQEQEYLLEMDKNRLTTKLRRTRYPHTALGISPEGLAIVATLDGIPNKAGCTIEEVAEIMRRLGAVDAILLGNGSEVAMYSARQDRLVNERTTSIAKGGSGNSPTDAATMTSIVYILP